jgi:hypothetical protein
LNNDTLVVINNGNVKYSGPVEISISGVNEIREINLDVGEKKVFRLVAPDGEYGIEVKQGEETKDLGRTYLTGNAISISDLTSGSGSLTVVIWLLVLLILGLIVFYLYRKIRNRGVVKKTHGGFLNFSGKKGENRPESQDISSGDREKVSVVSLNLKNLRDIESDRKAMGVVNHVLLDAREMKGKVKK